MYWCSLVADPLFCNKKDKKMVDFLKIMGIGLIRITVAWVGICVGGALIGYILGCMALVFNILLLPPLTIIDRYVGYGVWVLLIGLVIYWVGNSDFR